MDISSQRIKALREDNDLTQAEFGKILKTTQRRISYIESGKTQPTIEDIRIIAQNFNVSLHWLLGIDNH